jgi:hypothetical protein
LNIKAVINATKVVFLSLVAWKIKLFILDRYTSDYSTNPDWQKLRQLLVRPLYSCCPLLTAIPAPPTEGEKKSKKQVKKEKMKAAEEARKGVVNQRSTAPFTNQTQQLRQRRRPTKILHPQLRMMTLMDIRR